MEELGETEQLKDFIYLWLYFKEYQVTTLRFDRFEKRRKRTDPGTRNVVQTTTMENQPVETCFDSPIDAFLEKIRIIGIDISGQIKNNTPFNTVNFLETDLETFVFFFIKARNDVVIVHNRRYFLDFLIVERHSEIVKPGYLHKLVIRALDQP